MKDFVFSNTTKVYFGKDQLHHLSEEIAKFGKKVLLVYGGGSIKKIGLYDKVIAELKKADMTVFELGGVEPNPHHTTVNKGAALCKRKALMFFSQSAAARRSMQQKLWLPLQSMRVTIAGTSSQERLSFPTICLSLLSLLFPQQAPKWTSAVLSATWN